MEATSTAGDQSEYGPTFGEFIGGIALAVIITAFLAGCLWASHYFGWVRPQLDEMQVQVDEARVQLAEAQSSNESEYYRAVYDTCVWANSDEGQSAQVACLGFVGHVIEEKWYQQESQGW